MNLRVVIPPAPIVVPADIAGSHAANDAKVAATIAAVTEELDGPTGWLGRAIGVQTIEASGQFCAERTLLPCRPIIEIKSLVTEDRDGNSAAADPATWRQDGDELVIHRGATWTRRYRHIVRYEAGYDGQSVEDGGTGPVPARIKQAIIVMVQDLIATKAENLFLRAEEVEGIGSRQYTVSDQASTIIRRTADRLLAGLRVYA